MKKLLQCFENFENYYGTQFTDYKAPVVGLHPWMDSYTTYNPEYKECQSLFFGLNLKKRETPEMDEDDDQIPGEERPVEGTGENPIEGEGDGSENRLPLDEIVTNFFASLLPDEENYVAIDFPKEHFPKDVNLKISVTTREEIPRIIEEGKNIPVEEPNPVSHEGEGNQEYDLRDYYHPAKEDIYDNEPYNTNGNGYKRFKNEENQDNYI